MYIHVCAATYAHYDHYDYDQLHLIVYMQGQLDNTHRDSGINICIIEQISYKI